MLSYLDQDITYLKGVGPHRAQLFLSQLGIETVRDLLHNYPFGMKIEQIFIELQTL